jgi:hypothetical protein
MHQKIKQTLKRAMPTAYRTYRRLDFWWGSRSLDRLAARIAARHGWVVQSGPFAGMAYLHRSLDGPLPPRLLGCYEAELHVALARILRTQYDAVVDIGCAEGYYAVGLALKMPRVNVFAFDVDAYAQRQCRALAHLNAVSDRVHVGGLCTPDELRRLTCGRTLVISDCEGAEFELIRPENFTAVGRCDIVVELHDRINPQITPSIVARFEATHDIRLLATRPRDPSTIPAIRFLKPKLQALAVNEFRPEMQWGFLTPREVTP